MTELTRENIEDWDFRSTPRDPDADQFLSENFVEIMAIDFFRLARLQFFIQKGWAELSDDGDYVLLDPDFAKTLPYMRTWRDRFTAGGRLDRRVTEALVREWEKNGRLRTTILPRDLRKDYPGLFPPEES